MMELFCFIFVWNHFGLLLLDVGWLTDLLPRLLSDRQDDHYHRGHHWDEVQVTVKKNIHCITLVTEGFPLKESRAA